MSVKPTKTFDIYSGSIDTDPIDLRLEMDAILDGGLGIGPKGHWVIYRHYLKDEPSEFMSEYTDEGTGGPAYNYNEKLIKVFYRTVSVSRTEDIGQAVGEIPTDSFIYYLRIEDVDFDILTGYDSIFELNDEFSNSADMPTLTGDARKAMYRVLAYQKYKEQSGRVEYYSLLCKLDTVSWR